MIMMMLTTTSTMMMKRDHYLHLSIYSYTRMFAPAGVCAREGVRACLPACVLLFIFINDFLLFCLRFRGNYFILHELTCPAYMFCSYLRHVSLGFLPNLTDVCTCSVLLPVDMFKPKET